MEDGLTVKKRVLRELFFSFGRVGLFTVGGGYAMLPMLNSEVVEKHQWVTDEEMLDYYAIGQATPGVIAVNVASFVGYRQAGFIGSVVATIGIAFPSVVIISLIAAFLSGFQDNIIVQKAFAGIRIAVAVMILYTLISLGKKVITNFTGAIFALAGFALTTIKLASRVFFIAMVIFYAL